MVRLTDRPDMTLDVYRGGKTTIQQHRAVRKILRIITKISPYLELWASIKRDNLGIIFRITPLKHML